MGEIYSNRSIWGPTFAALSSDDAVYSIRTPPLSTFTVAPTPRDCQSEKGQTPIRKGELSDLDLSGLPVNLDGGIIGLRLCRVVGNLAANKEAATTILNVLEQADGDSSIVVRAAARREIAS